MVCPVFPLTVLGAVGDDLTASTPEELPALALRTPTANGVTIFFKRHHLVGAVGTKGCFKML